MKKKKKNKRFFFCDVLKTKHREGIASEYLPWLLIGIAILVILMITIFVLKGKGISLIDKIKDLFKFGQIWLSLL